MEDRTQPGGRVHVEDAVSATLEPRAKHSLAEDIEALYSDSKTYVQAELAFQKTRSEYAGKKVGNGIVFAVAAVAFIHLALIGFTIGLIIALIPLVGPWLATAIVSGLFIVIGIILALQARKKFANISSKFRKADQ